MGRCRKCGKELTGIETTGWFGKLCEKCWQEQHYTQYPFKKGIDEKDKKIADLEAKLAESEKDCEEFKKLAGGLREELIENDCMYKKEVDQLKQQLAEKENIIVEQKIKIRALSEENFLLKDDVQMAIKMQNKHDIEKNQTAIAELEKVKEFVAKKHQYKLQLKEQGNLTEYGEGSALMCEILLDKLDQQIKSLQGDK